ncbi:MAG: hypothetical protein RBS13_05915 [Bacteroidales bacterium]|jgi:tetratricopeptide (TPR) repeat protein|nr:hypothetical protein [Bacteroidales bacterium]
MIKKLTTLFIFTLFTLTLWGQTESEIIKQANELILNKKYESAFNLLDSFDPINSKADVVLLKAHILQNYFVSSIMHQMFALVDLNKNEDIMDYRGKNGSFSMQIFAVDSILLNLIITDSTNCKLYKGLGDYYFDVYLSYGEKWLTSNEELFELMQTNFQKVVNGNCADYMSYYVLGYLNLVQDNIKESIPYFLKSIELDKGYPSSHYNVAYAYLFTDDRENALIYAKNALDLYTEAAYKGDAARMLGQIYTELNDDKNALESYELANKIEPGNYYTLKSLLYLYVKTNNKMATKTRDHFFNLAPENPTIYNDIEEIYLSNKKELIKFYKSQFNSFKQNEKVQGNLNFYLAKIYLDIDKKLAKDYFIKAKDSFKKVFNQSHDVFNAIDEGLKQCEK